MSNYLTRKLIFCLIIAASVGAAAALPAAAECGVLSPEQSLAIRTFEELIPSLEGSREIAPETIVEGDLSTLRPDPQADFQRQFSRQGTYIEDEAYVRQLQQIDKLIEFDFPQHKNIPIAIYIGTGTDAVVAQKAFRSKLSIGVDDHPMWDPAMDVLNIFRTSGTNFRYSEDIDKNEKTLAPNLIGAFFTHIPEFRIRRLIFFTTQEITNFGKTAEAARHALLIFDNGPGTEIRAHLQLQMSLDTKADVTQQWWFVRAVQRFGTRIALIEKASHGSYNGEGNLMRDSLIQYISSNLGIWIESRNSKFETEYGFAPFQNFPNAVERRVQRWGYSEKLRIVAFSESPEVNRRIYNRVIIPQMEKYKSPYHTLPTGIREDLRAGFQALWELAKHKTKTFELLQELERDVIAYSQKNQVTVEEALSKVIENEEKRFGFSEPVTITSFLSQEQFMAHLAAGRPILDNYWLGKRHTRDGHRVQSVIEARYLARIFGNPGLYIKLYKEMGNRQAMFTQWKWEGTGIETSHIDPKVPNSYPDLWGFLHDSNFFTFAPYNIGAHDFTNPEYFSSLRYLLPGLRGWR